MPSIANPPPRPSTDWARPQRPLDEAAERQLIYEAERRLMTMRAQRPRFDEDEYLLKAVGTQNGEGAHQQSPQAPRTPALPLRHPEPPHRLIYTPKFNTGPPAAAPPRPAPSFRPPNPVVPPRISSRLPPPPPPPPSNEEIQVEPSSVDLSSLEKNPPDVENNIIVHIFLNAKEAKKPAHAATKIGPVHGIFGIGTAHGGPGTHQNPIVIVKDFDKDRLKFVDENTAIRMLEEGPANIVEVKAMVSTPDRKIEDTLNRAVNTELDRAIPMVLNRFHGAMTAMDSDLRKELEQALVDEIAKNLGETIDSMSVPGDVTEDDLGKLIEEGFNAVTESTTAAPTRKITVVSMTSLAPPTRVTTTEAPPTTRQTTMRRRVETTVGTRRTEAPTTTWVEVTATKATPTQATPTTRRSTEAPPTPRRIEAPPTERPTWRTEEPTTVWTEPAERITEAPPTPRKTEAPPTSRRTEAPPTPRRTEAPPTETPTEAPTRRTRPTTIWTPPTQRRTETPPTEAPPTETPPTPRRTEAPATRITRPPVEATEAPEEEPETPRRTEAPPTQAPPTSRKTPPTPYTWPQPPIVHETPEPETPEPIPETPPAWWTEAPVTETTATTTQTPPPRTFRIKTTAAKTTSRTTTEPTTTEPATRPAEPETTTGYVVPKETTARPPQTTTGYVLPKEPETKVSIDFHHEVEATTHRIAVELPTIRPAPPTSSEEDFNIVTSQPVHVVDLSSHEEVSGELEPSPQPVTSSQAPPTKATAPSVPIFNEGAFETTTTTAETIVTVTAEVTVSAGTVRPQKTIEHSMEKIEESAEEREDEKFRGITRRPPSSFGDANMMRQTTRGGGAETQTTSGGGVTQTTRARVETQTEEPFEKSGELFGETTKAVVEMQTPPGESAEMQTMPGSETQKTLPAMIETQTTAPWWSLTHSTTLQKSTEEAETQTPSQTQTTRARVETQTPPALESTHPVETQTTRLPFVTPDLSQVQSTEQPPFAPTWQTVPSSHEIDEIAPKGACPTPNDPNDKRRADVLFLLDSSNKFTEDKFMHAITLILDTVERLRNIGSEGVQVSLVQFNSEPYLEFSLRKHDCKQFLKDDIADTQYMTGGRMLGRALDKVTKFAFTRKRGDRPDAENILVILTDGQSEDHVQLPVKVSKDENVTVYVIGTLEANPEYLKNLAGNQDNVFQLNGTAHKPLAEQLAGKISKIGGDSREKSAEEEPMDVVQHRKPVDMNDISSEEPAPLPIVPQEHTGVVHLDCTTEGFKMKLNLPGRFAGHMVVKGFEKDPNCQSPIRTTDSAENRTLDFFVATDSCGVTRRASEHPKGQNTSVVVQLVHAPKLRTGEDRAFLLQCFVGVPDHDDEVSTRLDVVKGEVTVAETISLSSLPPTCNYSIRKDRPDGPVVTKAVVGQAVYHRWDCDGDEKANNVYGIKVHSCFASDDVEQKYPIVDVRGCSSDLALLTNPVYDEEKLSAYALSHVFGVLEADSLKFVCKLSLCTRDGDGCEGITPPMCSDNHTDLLVWKKAEAPDAALTSALMTEVDIGKEGAVSRAAHAVADSKILLALAAALVFVTAAAVVARKVNRRPPSSPSISTRASSQFEGSSSSSESQHSGAVPDPRLADFLKTFDRSRYV